jgi:hypothetical protein
VAKKGDRKGRLVAGDVFVDFLVDALLDVLVDDDRWL